MALAPLTPLTPACVMGQAGPQTHHPLRPSPAADQMNWELVQAPLVADLDWPDLVEAHIRALGRHCTLQDLDIWDQESSVMCWQLIVGIAQLHDESVSFRALRHSSCHAISSLDMLCRSTGHDARQCPPANL